jgi:hypothetical protein
MNSYIVTFDRKPTAAYKSFHDAFVKHREIRNWWHYIQSCYLVKTTLTANELSDHFTACARRAGIPTTHLVMKVDMNDRQGMLIKDAWAWIKENTPRCG